MLKAGDTLLNGQIHILRLLDRGGFGHVYAARDTLLERKVAIKELIPALAGDASTLKRFLGEARATIEINHPNIVRTFNVFREDGNYYIVMEYMAGGALEARLDAGAPLPVGEALAIARDVCRGLAHAHGAGIVHCDLKPANILFPAALGPARVADFGIAHMPGHAFTRTSRSRGGFVAGTLPYMSPEQTEGVRDDPRIDLYALGAVLYRMLTGRTYLDFDQRDTPVAQATNVDLIRRQRPPPPSAHDRRIPEWLDALVLKALAKDPAARHATARELLDALAGPGAPPATRRPVPARARAVAAATAAVALLLLGTLIAAFILGPGRGGGGGEIVPGPVPTSTLVPTPAAAPPGLSGLSGLGGRILYSSTRDGTVELAVLELPGGEQTTLARFSGQESWTSSVAADGSQLAYAPTYRDGESALFLLDLLGNGQTSLLQDFAPIRSLSLSPTGEQIAFGAGSADEREIYRIDTDGSDLTNLTASQGADSQPAWSPGGQRIAFVSKRDGDGDLYVMNPDGGAVTRLTDTGDAPYAGPAWSPGGEHIVFLGGGEYPNYDMYLTAGSGGVARLVDWPEAEGSPSYPRWSPGGRRLAFHGVRDGNKDIYTVDAAGPGLSRLTTSPADDRSPRWSPDGSQLAFRSDREGDFDIYVIPAEGGPGEPERLTSAPGDEWVLAWLP